MGEEKNVLTVVDDINNVLKNVAEGNTHPISEDVLVNFGVNVADAVKKALSKREYKRPHKVLRASEVGKPCSRNVWYNYHTPEQAEDIHPSLRIKFLYGDILEELVLLLAEAAGHTVTDHQEEVVIEMHNEWKVVGHIDAKIDGVVVDVKSASGFGFKKFQDGLDEANDAFGYRAQLGVYSSHEDSGFLVINKENGAITYCINEHDIDMEAHINNLIDELEEETPPIRAFNPLPEGASGNMKLCTECSYCAYKHHCWKESNGGAGLRTFLYSNKPVYLTTVVKEPKVFEVLKNEKGDEYGCI